MDVLKNLKNATELFLKNVPVLRKYYLKYKFRNELKLLRGKTLSESRHPSIIHVTLNRSASQWVKGVLRRCAVAEGLVHVRWNEMAFHSEYPFLDHLESVGEYEQIFHPEGYLYSAFGGYPKGIPQIEKYKVILVVRDPRDILVSRYFSMRKSHSPPPRSSDKREEFLKKRSLANKISIDEFVRDKQNELRNQYDQYLDHLLEDHPNVHVARYEDMVADVEEWLDRLLAYVELSPSRKKRAEIIEEARSIQTKEEDVSDHNRKGRPGDHVEKLRPDTIEELNKTFRPVLDQLGYDE